MKIVLLDAATMGADIDFSPLEKTIHKINFAKDDLVTITSHEVYFSLYQQLAGNEENEDEPSSSYIICK